MAMTDVGPFWIMSPPAALGSAAPTFQFWNNLDAANEAVGFVFRAPKTGTLATVEFRLGTVANAPDNGLRVSFQNLSGDFPDGTADQFRDVTSGFASNAWISTGLMTDDGTDTGTKRAVTAGDYIAVVIEAVSFTAGDNVNINSLLMVGSAFAHPAESQLYPIQRTSAGTWVLTANGHIPLVAVQYDDDTYAHLSPLWYPIADLNTATWNNTDTPDERGLRFQLPMGARLHGLWFRGDNTAALDVVLYDAAGSVVATVSVDSTIDWAASGNNFLVPIPSTDLDANSVYRVALKPTSGSDVTLYDFDVPSNDHLQAVDGGPEFYYTERADAGAWTDTTTKRPWMGLLIDGVDVAGGGSGGGETAHVFIG